MFQTNKIYFAALIFFATISVAHAAPNVVLAAGSPVISDATGAIAVARAFWYSRHPSLRAGIGSEESWETGMEATLENGVWHVRKKSNPDPNALQGSPHFFISPQDGRLVDFYYVHG
jgi:hypothetical protein